MGDIEKESSKAETSTVNTETKEKEKEGEKKEEVKEEKNTKEVKDVKKEDGKKEENQVKEEPDKKEVKEKKEEIKEEPDKKEVKEKKEEIKEGKKEEIKEEPEKKEVKEKKEDDNKEKKQVNEESVKKEEKADEKESKAEEKKNGKDEKENNKEMEIEKGEVKGEEKDDKKNEKKKGKKKRRKRRGKKEKDEKAKEKNDKMEIEKEEEEEEEEEEKEDKNKLKTENQKENKNEIKEEKEDNNASKNNIIIDKNILPRGLNNIGATCYMNSVLQCFYHVFDLSNELLKLKEIEGDKMPMTLAYLEVIHKLTFSKKNSISPYQFKMIISNNELFQGIGANDSKSLTLYILETLNEEFNENNIKIDNTNVSNKIRELKDKDKENIVKVFNTQYNSIVADLFYGLKMTTYKCLTCKDAPGDYQLFNIINLSIEKAVIELKKKKPKVDIIECLRVERNKQQFNGDNQLFCDKCNKMVDGESENRIYMGPKIMILFLDRGRFNRFRCEVTFPEKLNFKEFEEVDGGDYHLIGVIEHLGPSSNSGHFIAVCKHFDDRWYMFSDSSIDGPHKNYEQYGEPYLLFYRRD